MPHAARSWSLLLAVLAGCGSTHWTPLPPDWPDTWQGRRVHSTPDALVVAMDQHGAEQAHAVVATLRELWRSEQGADPGRGLVVAMDAGADLPAAGPEQWLRKVTGWHRQTLRLEPMPERLQTLQPPEDVPVDLAVLARIAAGGVPPDNDLALPARWLAEVRWVLVLPTRDCIDAMVDEVIDKGMAAKASFAQRLLVAPFLPMLKGRLRGQIEQEVHLRALEILCGPDGDRATLRRVAARAGLTGERSLLIPSPAATEDGSSSQPAAAGSR